MQAANGERRVTSFVDRTARALRSAVAIYADVVVPSTISSAAALERGAGHLLCEIVAQRAKPALNFAFEPWSSAW